MTWMWIVAGAAIWVAIVLVAVAACAASARADRAMDHEGAQADVPSPERDERHWGVDDVRRVEPAGRFVRRRHRVRPIPPR